MRQCYGRFVISKKITWAYFYSIKILQVYIIPSVRQCYGKCVVSREINNVELFLFNKDLTSIHYPIRASLLW